MFLRRNVASQTFTIPGSLRAVADGAAVTSGTITISKDGTEAAGAGTLAHISGGAFKYTPDQAETDCAIMGYVLAGTGAITVCGSIRTTNADPDDAAALGLTNLDAAVSTRSSHSAAAVQTLVAAGSVASVTGNVGGSVASVTAAVTVGTNNDKTGYALTAGERTSIATAVWASTTRLLTAGTNIVLAKGTGVTGFTDLDPAGVRDAMGMAAANLDAQIAALASILAGGVVLASNGLDAIPVEAGVNARQALSPMLAALGGIVSGAEAGAPVFKAGNDPTTTRITAMTDGNGNRSVVTLTLPT
jgi:hypothetical protein